MKRFLILALAASAAPAFAQVEEQAATQFQGNRAVQCDLRGIAAQIDFGNLGRNGAAGPETDSNISIFCNQPFSASVQSINGYLKLNATNPLNLSTESTANFESISNPGFAAGLDYTATIAALGVSASTSQINAGVDVTLGNSPALNQSGVSIRYDTVPGALPLLGGRYFDTLTLTLTTLGV